MKFTSKLLSLALVCLAMAACNKSVEEKTLVKENNGNNVESTNEVHRKQPECAQRNKDGTYKYGHACSQEEWIEWQKTQDASK